MGGMAGPATSGDEPTAAPLPQPPLQHVRSGAPPALAIEIEADDVPFDDGYQTDANSTASTSISPSVRDYEFENRRRYHRFKEGRYQFPNDESEQEREDMKHIMVVHICGGKLHLSPLENPQKILDIGTGTGAWVIDMADEYPEAEVIGIDLSPIQPSWVPPNARFLVDDGEDAWANDAPGTYDMVHLRGMAVAIKDWPKILEQAYRALKPGGWIEVKDFLWEYGCDDGTMDPDQYYPILWTGHLRKAMSNWGINIDATEKQEERIHEAGFTNVSRTVHKVPIGPWPRDKTMKKIGLYHRSVIYDGLHGISIRPLTKGLGWSPEEVEIFLMKVRTDLMNWRIHSFCYYNTVYAQKA